MSDIQEVKAKINAVIQSAQELAPEIDEFEAWQEAKPRLKAQWENLKEEVEGNRNAVAMHEGVIADLKRAKARAEEELKVVENDLARARADFEALVKRNRKLRKEGGA